VQQPPVFTAAPIVVDPPVAPAPVPQVAAPPTFAPVSSYVEAPGSALADMPYIVERKPVAQPEPVEIVPATAPAASPPFLPTLQPASPGSVDGSPLPTDPAAAPAAPVAPAAEEPMWPCPGCGTSVPMSLDHCNSCGAGFLAGASDGNTVRVPLIGDVSKISSGQKLGLGIAVAIGLMLLILILATIGGKLL
jgi:hypothetical protein